MKRDTLIELQSSTSFYAVTLDNAVVKPELPAQGTDNK
jgi:hypothetical protein